uniref:C2 domain-containing protein n=1 Tax=Fibrocapsa japonica TaxID=94617 RepID=A0A7S2V6C6_9STRA|mmetsp:Transcript_9175/g.14094  ORF Transcript_9175/g.14094 Transcript_9175/m.14094 type:complete len:148 (+) Transcript_9175:69-512(+)
MDGWMKSMQREVDHGTWNITVIEVKDIKPGKFVTKRDPYVKLIGNELNGQTEVVPGETSPVYETEFSMKATESENFLIIECWDHNEYAAHELIGKTIISLDDQQSGWFELKGKLQENVAMINLNFSRCIPCKEPHDECCAVPPCAFM